MHHHGDTTTDTRSAKTRTDGICDVPRAVTARAGAHGTGEDDRYIITFRADPTAWFRLYRLERFPELKRKYRFSLIAPPETAFGSNPTVNSGYLGEMKPQRMSV